MRLVSGGCLHWCRSVGRNQLIHWLRNLRHLLSIKNQKLFLCCIPRSAHVSLSFSLLPTKSWHVYRIHAMKQSGCNQSHFLPDSCRPSLPEVHRPTLSSTICRTTTFDSHQQFVKTIFYKKPTLYFTPSG